MRFFLVLVASVSLGAQGAIPDEQKAEFLRTARIARAEPVSTGVTQTWRLTLESNGLTHDASFQAVDRRELVKELPDGTRELNFVDSYRYNVAAYRLAKLIGLGNMVPVSVVRSWRGPTGALTWWVDDVRMDEAEMHARGIRAPDQADWSQQTYRVRVFTELIHDTDRNQGNHLITEDWKVWMIDFTRAFRRWHRLRKPEELIRCDKELFEALQALTREKLETALSDILLESELEAVLARRDLIVEHYERLVDERGAEQVFY